MQLSQESYSDYVGSLYFKACGVPQVKFSEKTVQVDGKSVTLIHIEGVQASTGLCVNTDLWPRNEAAEGDVIPESVDDVVFRVGYHSEREVESGEIRTIEGRPKWLALISEGKQYFLTGEKRQFKG